MCILSFLVLEFGTQKPFRHTWEMMLGRDKHVNNHVAHLIAKYFVGIRISLFLLRTLDILSYSKRLCVAFIKINEGKSILMEI